MARVRHWLSFIILKGLVLGLAGTIFLHLATVMGEAQLTKNVLVLYPFQMLAPGQLEFHQGLQETLKTRNHCMVDFAWSI